MRRLVLLPVLGGTMLLGCSPSMLPSDLGEHELDGTRLSESEVLEHLAVALPDGEALTVEDLFREAPGYVRAPDPSALLARMRDEHAALPPLATAEPLRVLSFNVGLLDRWYPFAVLQVPHVDERRVRVPAELLGDGWDVLLLQEVWDERDVAVFADEAARAGYLVHAGSSEHHEEHGLLMLVRESLVDPSGPDDRGEETFELQRGVEDFPGPGIDRGFLTWRFRHAPTGVVIDVFDTHTTAFPDLAWVREGQVRQLGLRAQEVPDDEVVVLAGDVNAGPYYPLDRFGEVDGVPTEGWWRNAQAYAFLLHYLGGAGAGTGAWDAHAAAGEAEDVAILDRLPAFGPSFHDEPLGDATLCDELAGVFTGSDCNSLYFEQYAATEYPARLDHVLVRDALQRVRVQDSAIVYTEPLSGTTFEASDHYGVGVTLLLSGQ
ncbi:endonuclease/exonuclease/phosphatase family protein [Paraliomyxa miuraensis]|uniref:endonuclease/exonuclease/phosphatase family protein n=1 Tax=Paraliomyxa miuraensis TaxID=376150 RepID=UPI00224FB1B4|nr:endonuclease/exonuclease/phosphatase family protein [Paraliomyxa miuraensis]MCX4243718.1 endonuclease/exonuclease/phosphatase family protein [Paraliomyxa miuraensis]